MMSRNHVIALAVVAGLLAALYVTQRASEPEADLERELDLVALAPEGFLASLIELLRVAL